ncbi:hypothetical protein [Polyangium aurulentum]|uniref:hypothetical protein n=1 Tax=Polyangium aurulentum TaxID=2567896 RepID=UPI0010ADF4AF|nr:hypothetical protein [Polyangium aurulentum]UQA62548.1 hypothetical protein E8A73_019670 [Polyangium aurulentum]
MRRDNLFGIGICALALALTACGSDVQPSGGGGAGGQGGGGGGVTCGGIAGAGCAADEFCDYPDDTCGALDQTGVCAKRPEVCSDGPPRCFCDGKISETPCPGIGGFDTAGDSNLCPDQAGTFPCGPELCLEGSQLCRHSTSDVGGEPDSWKCENLPMGCPSTPDCACLSALPCGDMCTIAKGGATLNCLGG